MSYFKKMYLVSEEDKPAKNKDVYENVMSPYLKSVNILDDEMKRILNSDLNESEKLKEYSNTLKKYLIHRFKYIEPSNSIVERVIEKPTVIETPRIKKIKYKRIKKEKISKKKNKKRRKIITTEETAMLSPPPVPRKRKAYEKAAENIKKQIENESNWESF